VEAISADGCGGCCSSRLPQGKTAQFIIDNFAKKMEKFPRLSAEEE
jgi:uncharacterized cysteine cluster protein YcgN (CxxCxxCC family)